MKNEGFEQLESHLLRKTALSELKLRIHHDHGSSRIINSPPKQVAPQSAMLTMKSFRKRLQRPVITPTNWRFLLLIMDQGINSLLEHSSLITQDDFRGTHINQLLKAVVSINDPTI